jgi:3-hydroxyacyl-CoA dehydrogenase
MKINLLGSGYMGKQICSLFVTLGYDVTMWQNSEENLDNLIKNEIRKLEKIYNITSSGDYKIEMDLNKFDKNFTIETLTEDINIKKNIISKLKYDENIFSNTSSLSANKLGGNINIMHFMNPITVPIVEIYRTEHHNKSDLGEVINSLKKISYDIIDVKDIPGFLVNRILFKNISYFFYLLENENIDVSNLRKIYKNIFNNDPIKIVNMIGLDTCLNILINLNKSDRSFYVSKLISESVKKNILGYKNKKLFKI